MFVRASEFGVRVQVRIENYFTMNWFVSRPAPCADTNDDDATPPPCGEIGAVKLRAIRTAMSMPTSHKRCVCVCMCANTTQMCRMRSTFSRHPHYRQIACGIFEQFDVWPSHVGRLSSSRYRCVGDWEAERRWEILTYCLSCCHLLLVSYILRARRLHELNTIII